MTGPYGIGKAALARRLAAGILYWTREGHISTDASALISLLPFPKAPEDSAILRRVLGGAHTDFLCVERAFDEKKNAQVADIKVEDIRALNRFCRHTAGEGGARCALIIDADTMNIAAQNALLKTLEEPGPDLYLILTATQPSKLLPTVRSRVQAYNVPPPDERELLLSIPDSHPKPMLIKALSQGSPGRAKDLAAIEELPSIWDGLCQITKTIHQPNRKLWWDFSSQFAGKTQEQSFLSLAEIWPLAMADSIKSLIYDHRKTAALLPLPEQVDIARALSALQALKDHFREAILRHLDRQTSVLTACRLFSDHMSRA